MKRFVLSVLAMLMILTAAVTVCAQDNTEITVPENYKGAWACERAAIDMIRKDSGYVAVIRWGSGADMMTVWQYTLGYDAENDCLADNGTGTKTIIKSTENGDSERTDEYTDGTARFSINDAGMLTWEDGKEDSGHDMQFEKMDYSGFMPTQEQFIEDYFHVIGAYHQGTAGSSLAAAQAAYKAYDFAQSHRLWAADTKTLRDGLLKAWESMSDEERSAFDANFISTLQLINSCMEDWESNKGVFADAGVPDRMKVLLEDPESIASWDVLSANTLTMGNSDR